MMKFRLTTNRAVFLVGAALATLYGGAKHATGRISYPRTDPETWYLMDNGSYVTNDAVHVAYLRNPILPDAANFFIEGLELSYTNESDWAEHSFLAYSNTLGGVASPFDMPWPAATNYNWIAYTDWVPPPTTHTNGVAYAAWQRPIDGATNKVVTYKTGIYIDARRVAPNVKRKPTAKDYVQYGLVAMWDGIENAGWGTHDPNATVWKDLTGNNYDWLLDSRAYWGLNHVAKNGSIGWVASASSWGPLEWNTFECCIRPIKGSKDTGRFFSQRGIARGNVVIMTSVYAAIYNAWNSNSRKAIDYVIPNDTDLTLSFVAATSLPYDLDACYVDGFAQKIRTQSYGWSITSQMALGGNAPGDSDYPFSGRIYNIRLYSRALTAEEIAHNHEIDKERFNLP